MISILATLLAAQTVTSSAAIPPVDEPAAPRVEAVEAVEAPAVEAPPTEAPLTVPTEPAAPAPEPAAPQAPAPAVATAAPASDWLDRWGGTQLWVQTSANFNTFAPDFQLTPNKTVDSTAVLSPRFTINADFQLRARFALGLEWTNSDITNNRYEAEPSDTSVQLFYRGIPAFFGAKLMVAPQVVLPTSEFSRARTMIFTPGLTAQIVRGFDLPVGNILALGILNYQRPLYRSTTPELRQTPSYAANCYGGSTNCAEQASGMANVRDSFSWTMLVLGTWGDWSPAILFQMAHQVPFGFQELDGVSRLDDTSVVRVNTFVSAWLDYNVNNWLTAEVGYSMFRNILDGDGRYGNPFWSRNQDMRLYLGFNVALDQFYRFVRGDTSGEGGVVRQ